VQYVSVMAGWGGADGQFNAPNRGKVKPGYGRMLTFAVGGTATLNARAFGHPQPPTPAINVSATAEAIHDGGLLYGAQCAGCHGLGAVAGPLPDLRYASKAVHEQFEAIVLGGARSRLGMPSFKDLLTAEQVRAIQAYILSRAKAATDPASR
jgi:mono/diheme cytochrome c family protein